MVSTEELNDLRRAVLRGENLSVDDAKRVFEAMRADVSGVIAGMAPKPRAARGSKKPAMTDEALDSSLDDLLNM